MVERYSILETATLEPHFLKTNASSLSIFSAIAELVDNSCDANAKSFKIYDVEKSDLYGGWYICFLDDGEGMSPHECYDVKTFGRSKKRLSNDCYIGRNGVGLKSATFRLANDFIMFTKKKDIFSIIFWSQTFYKEFNCDSVIVAIPSFTKDKKPYYDPQRYYANKDNEKLKHNLETELIFKYSPFKSIDAFFQQFNKIEGPSGTLVICYNLWLTGENKTEFYISKERNDLLIRGDYVDNSDIKDWPLEKKSFREYVSILYTNPKMKIYIDGSIVRTKTLWHTLYLPCKYDFFAKNIFKRKTEIDIENMKKELEDLNQKLREAQTKESYFRNNLSIYNEDSRAQHRKLQNDKVNYETKVKSITAAISDLEKKGNGSQLITFHFGANVLNPSLDGYFFYNGVRLIATPDKLNKIFEKKNDELKGFVGIITIPYSVMEPSQYKSDILKTSFEKEINKLSKVLDEHIQQYLDYFRSEIKRLLNIEPLSNIWDYFGYDSNDNLLSLVSFDPKIQERYYRRRFCKTKTLLQCDLCNKWRLLCHENRFFNFKFPENWKCEDISDIIPGFNCQEPEIIDIPIKKGEFIKELKQNNFSNRRFSTNKALESSSNAPRGSLDIENIRNLSENSNLTQNLTNTSINIIPANYSFLKTKTPSNSRLTYNEFLKLKRSTGNENIQQSFIENDEQRKRRDSSDFDDEICGHLFNDKSTTNSLQKDVSQSRKRKKARVEDKMYKPPSHITKSINVNILTDTARIPVPGLETNQQNNIVSSSQSDLDNYEIVTEIDYHDLDSLIYNKKTNESNNINMVITYAESLRYILNEIKYDSEDFENFSNEDLLNYDIKDRFNKFLAFMSNKIEEKDIKIFNLKQNCIQKDEKIKKLTEENINKTHMLEKLTKRS